MPERKGSEIRDLRRDSGSRHLHRHGRRAATREDRPLHRRTSHRRARHLPGDLLDVPLARHERHLRSPSAGRRQFHEHVAQPPDERPLHSHPQHHADQQSRLAQRPGRRQSRRVYSAGKRRRGGHAGADGGDDCADRSRRDTAARRRPPQCKAAEEDAAPRASAAPRQRPSRTHRRGRSEKLRSGDRRDAPQTRSRRLADRPRKLSGLEPQRARANQSRQREGPAAGVVVEHERQRGGQRADAARPQRHHLPDQHRQHPAGARRAHRRPHLGKPHAPAEEPGRRHGRDAQHGHLPGQSFRGDDGRASVRARRAHRQNRVGRHGRRQRQGLRKLERADHHSRQSDSRRERMRPLQGAGKRSGLLHQRVRSRDWKTACGASTPSRARASPAATPGAICRTCCASARKPGSPAASIPS